MSGDRSWVIHEGCVSARLPELAPDSIQSVVTSPPYWGLRDYGSEGQYGLEDTPEEYVSRLVGVFRDVRRVLRDDGTVWLNLGDSYNGSSGSGASTQKQKTNAGSYHAAGVRRAAGLKPKDLVGIPWRVALALQADGWYLRSDIIWHKPNPMPESVKDRPTGSHEYVFLFSKRAIYYYDSAAISETATCERVRGPALHPAKMTNGNSGLSSRPFNGVRNKRTVWTITTRPYAGAHFAVMPPALAELCVKASTRPGDVVLDPFCGAGTVGVVATRLARSFVGVEINPAFCELGRRRIEGDQPLFNREAL